MAVKSLTRAAGDVGEAPLRAFHREIRVLAALRHPNVLPMFGLVHARDGSVKLVVELAVGGDLFHTAGLAGSAAPGTGLPPAEALRLALDVARGLAYAHSRGVTHNDLKSLNILLDGAGGAKLCDFGLAKCVRAALPNTMAVLLSSTGGGGGTIPWTAPENLGDPATPGYGQPPADVHSFGCVLYELLTGRTPFFGLNLGATVAAIMAGRRPEFPAGSDARLAGLARRCWASAPAARPTAGELVAALSEWASGGGGAAPRPLPPLAAPDLPPVGWACGMCTLVNEWSARQCAACEAPAPGTPAPSAAAAAAGGGGGGWAGAVVGRGAPPRLPCFP